MNKLTGFILFFSGAVVGAVGSLFYLRGEFNKKVEEEVAARDMAIRELKRMNSEKEEIIDRQEREFNDSAVEALTRRFGYVSDSEGEYTTKVQKSLRTHSGASQGHSSDREGVIFSINENGEAELVPSEGISDIPYGISTEDFIMGHKEFDKTTLLYYEKDGVLSNENGDVVEDISYVLGDDWKRHVGKYEDGIAYIRNERSGTDYEVVCENKKYKDEWGNL